MTIKVMIVDDSAVIRKVLSDIINKDPALELMAAVIDPIFAMKRLEKEWPDVMVLDVEMPRMDGITFLRKIMVEHPIPVVICSTLTEAGAETTMQAMSSGAVNIVTKPKIAAKAYFQDEERMFVDAIKSAAQADVKKMRLSSPTRKKSTEKLSADAMLSPATSSMSKTTERVVAIGTSTGGTQALETVLVELPRTCLGMVIVQHMPEKFTAAFSARLNSVCDITVKEARDGDRVLTGQALIAPGGKHMLLRRSGAKYYVEVKDGPLVSRHKPSVDVLFRSVAKTAGSNALGIIMTGMGDDGAHGMKEMHDLGAETIAQDEETCVVYGMPKEAVKLNAIDKIIPLDNVPNAIIHYGSM